MEIVRGRGPTAERHARVTVTFANSSGAVTVFTITGRVRAKSLTAFCTADVVEDGAVTGIELGTTSDPNSLIVSTDPADIDTGEWWADATPVAGSKQQDALQSDVLISEDVILTITGGTDLDSGTIVFDVWYVPVTDNGALA